MIGYSLNDLNVLSAVDYSKNVYNNDMPYDTPIIQLLRKEFPNNEPYYSDNGIIVQEISDLSEFLSEYLAYEKRYRSKIGRTTKQVNELVEKFTTAGDSVTESFIRSSAYRLEYIKQISELDQEFWYIYSSYTAFLNKCFGVLWNRASAYNAFDEYNNILLLLIDVIKSINYDNVPASFIEYVVGQFADVAYYVGNEIGKSFSAHNTWLNQKDSIPNQFINEYTKRRKDEFKYQCGLKLIEDIAE